jgi:predicted RNA binding protein YcfA (HicA-like mRNA interferase family)
MPKLSPISWNAFVRKMKAFGWCGPFQEGRHPYMVKGNISVTIPNPHRGDMSIDLLSRILRQAVISKDDWSDK